MFKKIFLTALIITLTYSFSNADTAYVIQADHNDETFIINDEVFKAQTYCFGWSEGEMVIFLDGSHFGVCVSATLYNIDRREKCDVWCE